MTRPRLLDLFCGAGGCSVGYHRAGFDVVGVDIEPHDDYPFEFHHTDAMKMGVDYLTEFDVVHASPPCQGYTTMSNRRRGEWPDLLEPVRDLLVASGGRYVIENVPGARSHMREPFTLHGGMFGLPVARPRLFETNMPILIYRSPTTTNPVGVYGARPDGRRLWTRADGSEQRAAGSIEEAGAAMGIDWMTDWRDIAEAIPPAYCEFIGAQLLDWLRDDEHPRVGSSPARTPDSAASPGRRTGSHQNTGDLSGNVSSGHWPPAGYEETGESSLPSDRGQDAPA